MTTSTTPETENRTPENIKYKPMFELVEPKDNWKKPINALVDPMDLVELGITKQDLSDAVEFFTGAPAVIVREGNKYRVTAPGYYIVVGA
jgi:hypothetical protein